MAILRFKGREWKSEGSIVTQEFNTLLEIVMKEYFQAPMVSLDLAEQFKPKTEVEINKIFTGESKGILAVNVFWHDAEENVINSDIAFIGG